MAGRAVERASNDPKARTRRLRLVAGVVVILALVLVELRLLHSRADEADAASSAACGTGTTPTSVLLVGNSYVGANDLVHTLARVLCSDPSASVHVDVLWRGGWNLGQWADGGATDAVAGHDIVVLQDQSEIPGLGDQNADYQASLAGTRRIAAAATAAGARVVLLETWAHERGEAGINLFQTYPQMQIRIANGYDDYLAALRSGPAPTASVARVGDAWFHLYDHDSALFTRLYADDQTHPSVAGTYLAALVLARSITGHTLVEPLWKPASVSDDVARDLEQAAAQH